MLVRPETPADSPRIRELVTAAFKAVARSNQTEAAIVDALRRNDALTASLVVEHNGSIIGHVAFSPVAIDGRDVGWFGLGPVSVSGPHQRQGVGTALIEAGLTLLKQRGAAGCVVLGDPAYYSRFGFTSDHGLRLAGVPPRHFQSLAFSDAPARGEVTYHESFEAT